MTTVAVSEATRERIEWLEESRVRAAEGAVRLGRRLREVEDDSRRQTVRIIVLEDAMERIANFPHSHEVGAPCAACLADSALRSKG